MSFTRPTLPDLVTRIQADFVSKLELSGSLLRRAMVYVFARVVAGAAHLLHGHLDFLARQLFPDQSEDEFLVRQASLFIGARTPPTFAKASVAFSGTNGNVIRAGALVRNASGLEYSVDADATVALGSASCAVTALVAGSDSSLAVADLMSLESPVAGVSSSGAVSAVVQDGTDQETVASYRSRLLARMANPPQGGNDADYIAWARSVSGVTRVWVTDRGLGPGTVLVRFARDDDPSPYPDSGEVAAVQAVLSALAPAHATVTAAAPTEVTTNFTIHIVPDTTDLRAAVTAQLNDMLFRDADPRGFTMLLSHVHTAIGSTPGVTDYTLSNPVADTTFTAGQLPHVGTVTFL